MPTKFDWCSQIKGVEREFAVLNFALRHALQEAIPGRLALPKEYRVRELEQALDLLEGTYTIRLFAEFETCLKSWWRAAHTTDPPSRAFDLISGTAARRKIPHLQQQNVHEVREYRNSLVHDREEETASVSISNARGHLCRFINFLPDEW